MADILTVRERAEVEAANASGRRPVVFVHGLWLHSSSWAPWAELFASAGYTPLMPGWPGEPDSVGAAREHPEAVAGRGVADITERIASIVRDLRVPPLLVGHSFGGLIVQKLLTQNLGAGAVAIDAAQFRGVLRLPLSALRSAFPGLRSPSNLKRSVSLSADEFRFAFANAVSPIEAAQLYELYPVPSPGRPLFQLATANLDPKTEASVDVTNAKRGPLLLIKGELDHTVPASVVDSEYALYQKRTTAITELELMPGRGHSLTIDSGWRDVAQRALSFGKRFVN